MVREREGSSERGAALAGADDYGIVLGGDGHCLDEMMFQGVSEDGTIHSVAICWGIYVWDGSGERREW